MAQTVIISSLNFSGEQANIIFTPQNSSNSYGLGTQVLPFTFDTSTIDSSINATGTYSINIINSSCSYVLVVN